MFGKFSFLRSLHLGLMYERKCRLLFFNVCNIGTEMKHSDVLNIQMAENYISAPDDDMTFRIMSFV